MKIPNKKVRLQISASDDKSRKEYSFDIEFFVFREKDRYIAYCPSLDISTSGENFNDAIGNFYEMFQLHIECCLEAGTLYEDLIAHGWKIKKKSMSPPSFHSLMKQPEMKSLMEGNIGYEKVVAPVKVPAFV